MSDCIATADELIATAEGFVTAYRELAEAHRKAAEQTHSWGLLWSDHTSQAKECDYQEKAWRRTAEKLKEEARHDNA